MHFVTRVTPIDDFYGKSHKPKLKNSRDYSTNYLSQNHVTSYLWPRGCTHTHTFMDERDFKEPGVCWPVTGVHLV